MKWQHDTTNPAGPIQVKRINDALGKVRWEHNTKVEIWGVRGGEEHSNTTTEIFGVNVREDVKAALEEVGAQFAWTISRDNAKEIEAALLARLPALKENRPVTDNRRTPEEDAARVAESARLAEERRIQDEAKRGEQNKIAATLREKYPWALPADSKLSCAARAAANCKVELVRAFPGHAFSVRSDGNSIDIRWTAGPTIKEVEAITGKYQNASFDGMTDSTEYDHSAYGEAVSEVLGRVRFVSERRDFDEDKLMPLLLPALCQFENVTYDPNVKPYDLRLPDENGARVECGGNAVLAILQAQSFPPGAVITGLEEREWKEGDSFLNEWGNWYKATFDVPLLAHRGSVLPSVTAGAEASVAYNEEHNGIEVRFPGKPDPSVISALKASRFRWSPRSRVWYAKASDHALDSAARIAGLSDEDRAKVKRNMDGAHEDAGVRGMEMACGIA